MSLLGDVVGGALGFMLGGPIFGTQLGTAIGAGLGDMATGGSPEHALAAGFAGYFAPDAFGFGSTGASTLTGIAAASNPIASTGASGVSSLVTGGATGAAGGVSPLASAGSDLSLGGTMSAAVPGVDAASGLSATELGGALSSGIVPESLTSALTSDPAALTSLTGNQETSGMLSKFLNWAKANKGLAAGALQTVGGILNGIGTAANQRETLQYQQQLAEQLARWERGFVRSGSVWGGKVGMSPTGAAATRPGGAPVYGSGGLISNAIVR